jgi:hypothetical protein
MLHKRITPRECSSVLNGMGKQLVASGQMRRFGLTGDSPLLPDESDPAIIGEQAA